MAQTMLFMVMLTIFMLILAAVLWLFGNHGLDRICHPEEWRDAGKSGERVLYNLLLKQLKVPEKYILRNVYIPTEDGRTSKIDMLVVSRKGILVFECKNYAGNIYGDAQRQKWVQYLGKKRSYFYNPFMQNRGHVENLRNFLSNYDVPIIPFVATITRGSWKIKNFGPEDYLLDSNCHLRGVLAQRRESDVILQHVNDILDVLTPLSRPSEDIRQAHIARVQKGATAKSHK